MNPVSKIRTLLPNTEVWTDPEKLESYRHDEALTSQKPPLAVVFPKTADEVCTLLREATQSKIPVIPRGAGSGLSGAAVPTAGAIILSLERMNRILEISTEDRVAVVEPGVITGEIRRAVEEKNLFYPPIPASVDLCSIGGNVATNAGGLCAVKYGVTRDYVMGLEVVLPTGEVMETGGRTAKNSTGYNLTQLIVGSEGTLAVITKILLKLLPLPKERFTVLAAFQNLEAVTEAVLSILDSRVLPPTLELIPQKAVDLVLSRHSELSFPFKDREASLLIELDNRNATSLERDVEELQRTLEGLKAEVIVATSPSQREELWTVRKSIRDSIAKSGPFVETDSVVPRRHVPRLITAAHEIGKKFSVEVISYGHAGDGNLHTYFRQGKTPDDRWQEMQTELQREFFQETIALGGTLSGEHGIGLLKRDFMPMAFPQSTLQLMKRLKTAFDPANILNPGKVFPE